LRLPSTPGGSYRIDKRPFGEGCRVLPLARRSSGPTISSTNSPAIAADRALALNPSYARGWFVSGLLRVFAGQPDLAIEHLETSLRLSPRERVGAALSVMGAAYFFKRRFDEAEAKLLSAIQDHPGSPISYRILASCYAHMGRLDEARAIVVRLRAITSLVMPSDVPFRKPEDRELILSGLRLAAGEKT
jgi:adenylate cyclase